jgi:hypothetical protein
LPTPKPARPEEVRDIKTFPADRSGYTSLDELLDENVLIEIRRRLCARC